MKQAQETSDFYPTRRASEAPPEHVIGGGFKPDLSGTPDLPESGVTFKHVRETVRGILTALKGTATLLAVAVSAMLMAESITGTEGEMLENLPGDSTVILDAPAVKQLLQGKADAGALSGLSEQLTAHSKQLTALEAQVPVVRATLGAANNNANGYGYRGPLSRLGVYGEAVVVRRLAITTRASGNQNTTVPLWARVVRNVDGAWVVCAQAKEPRRWEEVAPGAELAWEMEAVPGVLPPSADETVAIVWVNDPDAPAAQSDGQVSWRTVTVSGGLGLALPTVPTTSSSIQSWSPRIVLDFTAVTKALKVDTSLSSISTNPVQSSALYYAINDRAPKSVFNSDYDTTPYVRAYGASTHTLRTVFNANNEADNWAEKFDNAKLTFEWWHQYNNVKEDSFDVPMTAFRELANGGGGHTEVWRGNVGFGEQDTFFGPRRVAEGEGQFYKGYPRLHNHGQDIHEVSGFSRDSRDDETVWSHRLLLPWDLAKANDTSYLMAGVVWNGKRRILNHPDYGLETTFVQPLIPENTGGTKSYGLTHAIPCFENSPMYWNGNIIYNDSAMLDSGVPAEATKAVIVPWERVTGTVGSPTELALKSDLDGLGGGATLNGEATGVHLHQNNASLSVYSDSTASRLEFYISGASSENGSHYVPTTSVTDALAAQVAGKADAKHLHAIEDVTNLGSTLDKKISGASTPDGQTLKLEGLKSSDGTSYDFSLKRDFDAKAVHFGCEMSGAIAMFDEALPTTEITDALAARIEAMENSAVPSSTFTEPVKIQSGMGTGSLWIGGDVNSGKLTNKQRHLARIVVPTFEDVTKSATLLGFDSSGDSDLNVANRAYDTVSFGGSKKITNSTSPMAVSFCVTKARGAMSASDKVYPLEMDANEARFNVRPNYNGVPLATMNDLEVKDDEGETGWVSPGDWTLSVTPAEEYAVIDSSVVVWTNNVQQVIGTATSSTLSAAAKMVSLEMLDVAQPAPTVSFACEGATITRGDNAQSALVTAEAEGLYRVSATDDTGRMRTAYLSIRAKEKSTTVEQAYLADVPGTARATANDAMLAALQTRDTSTTVQSGITAAVATGDLCFDASGAPLSMAPLAPRFFCGVEPSRAWGPDAVAVAPHFAVTAAHWNPAQVKTATFRTPEGASVTVSGTYGISLVEWARQRGYSESEIRDADLADIWVWQFDNGTIPETCIPAVLDRSAWEHYYRSDLTGVACYAVTQNGYLSFGELLHPDGGAYSIGSFTPERTRADLLATLSPPACALIYGGDSGRPVMMIHEGEPVLLSTFWTAGSGPSMIKACNILDDLIKTRSGGTESLKRISAP